MVLHLLSAIPMAMVCSLMYLDTCDEFVFELPALILASMLTIGMFGLYLVIFLRKAKAVIRVKSHFNQVLPDRVARMTLKRMA